MKTVLIDYATISPAVLESIISKVFDTVLCSWTDMGEDYFEFRVYIYKGTDLIALENLLGKYV